MTGALPYLAISMGLMSSFHCIGMCGPIALALPVQRGSFFQKFGGLFIYNGGRALTYAALGATIGTIGSSLAWLGYIRYLSVFAGILILVFVFWPTKLDRYFHPPLFWKEAINHLKKGMSQMLHSHKMSGWLMLGMLNGLLPCGLVYLALISSVATGTVAAGSTFMFLFGIGTLPMMMTIGFLKNRITPSLRNQMRKLTPVMLAVAGIWMVGRGIFIQYPLENNGSPAEITICHGK